MNGSEKQINVAEGVVIEDAFVNWHLNSSNTPELYAVISDSIPISSWGPVSADREDEHWIVENDHGLFRGFADSPQQPPADTGPRTRRVDLDHVDGDTASRVPMYDHVVQSKQNDREADSSLGIHYTQSPKGSSYRIPTRVDVGQKIIDRYVNGELGSSGVSYWYWVRSHPDGYGFRRGPLDKADYEEYDDCEVVLVKDWIYVWRPKRSEDVEDDDDLYQWE